MANNNKSLANYCSFQLLLLSNPSLNKLMLAIKNECLATILANCFLQLAHWICTKISPHSVADLRRAYVPAPQNIAIYINKRNLNVPLEDVGGHLSHIIAPSPVAFLDPPLTLFLILSLK